MVAFLQRTLLACLFLLAFAVPSFGQTPVYNAYEVGKLREYFNANSISSSSCNGTMLNTSYNPNDPSTYPGVTWSSDATNKRATDISLYFGTWGSWCHENFGVILDISGFTLLKSFSIRIPKQSVVVKDCPLLGTLNIDSWTEEIGNVSCSNLPSLTSANIFSDMFKGLPVSHRVALDFTKSLSLVKFGVSSIDMRNILFDKSKITNLTLSGLGLDQYPYNDYPNVKDLTLSYNSLTSFEPAKLSNKLVNLNLEGNCFTLSALYAIKGSVYNIRYASQRKILVGNERIIGSTKIRSIGVDEVLDLSNEYLLGTSETKFVWKKSSDNTVITPKTSSFGRFTFGADVEGQAIYCEITNDQLPDFTRYGVLLTCDVYVGTSFNEYNPNEVAKLQAFLNQPSVVAGKSNGQQVNDNYNLSTPSTYTGVKWSSNVVNKQVVEISWGGKKLAGALDLGTLLNLQSVDVNSCFLTSLKLPNSSMLKVVRCSYNNLKMSGITAANNFSTYVYVSQRDINIGKDTLFYDKKMGYVGCNEVVDLSSEAIVNGVATVYKWKNANTNADVTPTSSNGGKFTFNQSFGGEILYCGMSNSSLPNFSGDNVLKTRTFLVGKYEDRYNSYEISKIRQFLSQPSKLNGTTNLNSLGLSEFNVMFNLEYFSWSNEPYNRRVLGVSFVSDKCYNLKGGVDFSNFTSLYGFSANSSPIESVDLTGCSSLNKVTISSQNLKKLKLTGCVSLQTCLAPMGNLSDIDLTTNNKLSTLDLSYNCLMLSKLPKPETISDFKYSPQFLHISRDTIIGGKSYKYIKAGRVIDFSEDANVYGSPTTFTWIDYDSRAACSPTKSENGKFVFDDMFVGKTIQCTVTNPKFPQFPKFGSGNGLQTDWVLVVGNVTELYNPIEGKKIRDFLDQPSAVTGKTNGLLLNDKYNPTDPATYSVGWNNSVIDRRVDRVSWEKSGLKGNLDLQNFSRLSQVYIYSTSSLELNSVDVSNCLSLKDLTVASWKHSEKNVIFKGCINIELMQLRGCKLTSIDVSFLQKMKSLWLYDNNLQSINLDNNGSLKELSIDCNNFKLSTLPVNANYTTYDYHNQIDYLIGKDTLVKNVAYRYVDVDSKIDLSSEANIRGVQSKFVWKRAGTDIIVSPTTNTNGIFTFDSKFEGEELQCEIFNDLYSNIYNTMPYLTSKVIIGKCFDAYDSYEVGKLKEFFLKPSNYEGRNNASVIQSTIDVNDPKTYSVSRQLYWTPSKFKKRIKTIDFSERGVKGNLDISNFAKVDTVLLGYNYLEGINVNGCNSLISLDIRNNKFLLSSTPLVNYKGYNYAPQKQILIGRDTVANGVNCHYMPSNHIVDFSKEVNVNGTVTEFVWKNSDGSGLVKPKELEKGKFLFSSDYDGEQVFCELSNSKLLKFAGGNVLKTKDVVLGSILEIYNPDDVKRIKEILELPSSVSGKSNGELLSSSYDKNNPSTFPITWNSNKKNKRIKEIAWAINGLTKNLVISNFSAVKSVRIVNSGIESLVVDNCPNLIEVVADQNKLREYKQTIKGLKWLSLCKNQIEKLTLQCSDSIVQLVDYDNNLKFSTLPILKELQSHYYSGQFKIKIGRDTVVNNTPYKYVALGKIIDLSSEATINKKPTTYTWRKRSDNSVVIPATNNGGKFTFDISLSGEIVYCEMSNATFPDLSGANSLKTVDVVIDNCFEKYNAYEVAKLKAYFGQPSTTVGKTIGQNIYSGYNPNDPGTYPRLTWSSSAFDKRVITISRFNSNEFSGFLDLSNFIQLTSVDVNNNYLSKLDFTGAIKLTTVNCSGNSFKFSTLPPKGASYANAYTYAPQRTILIGRDTVMNGNSYGYSYITSHKGVNLSSEKVVNGQNTLYVWKNTADGSIVTPLSSEGGIFTFPESIAGNLIYCELTNPSFPDFAGQKVLKTEPVLVEGRYNKKDVSILKTFLQQESAVAGKKNYQNINLYSDLNDPSSWGDVEWTSSPTNKRVKSIYWLKKDLAGSLILSGLDSLKSVEVMMNKITSISFDNCTRLEKIRLDEAGLTLLNTSSLTGLKRIDVNNSKISDVDLSSNSKLETVILRHNQLTSVKLPTSLTFKELDLKGNSFRLSTLPSAIGPYGTYYSYSAQKPMVIGVAVQERGKIIYQVGTYSAIDLSSEFTIAGKQTEYKWWNVSKNTYTTPYSSNGGKFTFDSSVVGDTLLCEMKNEAFPLYDPVYPYSTVKVVVKAGYDEYEVGKLKAFLDQPSSEAGKTNGQKVNAAYDPNDPSTFGVTWTSVALDKKVTNIYWSNKGLKGDLDFSNFMQLTDLYAPYNQLITLEVIGCIVLKDLVIQENQLTSIDISNCNQLGNFNCRNNKLATINVSSLAKLTYLDVSNNSLASLDLSGNALLTSLICFYNQLKFSTLPVKSSLTNYSYIPQGLVIIGRDTTNAGNTFKYVGIGKTIDLSSEASINGNPTTFVWKKTSDNSVVTPVTSVGGMFTFGSNLAGQTIYCEMSNATFPKFSGNDVLKTVGVVVGNDCYNAYEVEKLKVFLNQPSAVAGKSNGQQVNADYNENDPSTFGVWWSSSSLNKKVESISWVVKSLAGTLDCSNFSLLKYIFVWDNKLIGLNVDGAISLITLDVNSNLLASLNLSSNTKLTELGLRQNNFSYSTLPEKPTLVTTYLRAPQNMLVIGEKQVSGTIQKYVIGAEQVVDISKEYSVKGFQTSFTWKDSNGSVITPSTSSNGKFSFNSTFVGKKVYCEMANAGFSDFTGSSILRTVTVEILQAYNQNDVDKLKAFLNKPSAEAGKTNGQQVNASYNANDPATYGVNWSKHSANKRVVNFQWLNKNLAGDLDLSSCELLTVAWLSDNKLTSLNLKGCTELTDLDARMNELATVSMDSHPKLTSIDLSTNKLSSLSVVGVPNLSMLFLFNNQLTQLDLSKVTSLTRLKVYNNALTSLDISGLSKLQLLKAEQNKLTSVKFGSNAKLELVNLDGNMLSAVDVVGLPALKDLTVSNNKFNLSKIPSKNTTYTSYIYAPQPTMVVGHATQDGNITKYSIYADEPIDLSSELTIGGNTTTFVWKKADGTAVHPTSAAGGVFTFTNSFIGETIYGELTNSSFPDFAADKSYRTVQVTIQSPYNADEVAALTRFFNKPSAAAGSTNGEQIGITNKNNPSTWKGVTWSNEVLDRRVISIFWSGLNVSDTLNLTGFGKIGALDVTSNMLNKVVVDQTPLLKNVLLANNNLRFSTMPTIDSYDQYSSFPQSKLVVGTKSTDGLGDGYTLLAGEQVNLSSEYTVAGQITTFVWKDNVGNVIVPTKSNNGRFFFNKEFIGKKVHCELSNSKFPGGILETVEILIPGSQFEKNFGNKVSFILYPNPTTRSIKIETTDLIQSYRIFASNGVELLTAELNDFRLEIDVQRLRPGIYFIEIRVGSQAYRSKFIKQ